MMHPCIADRVRKETPMSISSWLPSLRSGGSPAPAQRLRQRPEFEVLEDRSLMNATLSISNPDWYFATIEGDSGTVNARFIVQLSEPAMGIVTVNYATVDGTAKAKSDYVPT